MITRPRISQTDAAAVAADGFVFGYPLVLMDRVRAVMTAVPEPDPIRMRAPVNRFAHARELPGATMAGIAHPDCDTLHSSAWLDLEGEPVLLTVPETHGRFYVFSLVDLWTNVFASVGARATGAEGGVYAIRGPRWEGRVLPPEATAIRAPTRMVRIAGRTQVDGDEGYAAAHAFQDGCELRPLSGGRAAQGRPRAPSADVASPAVQVERMPARAFFHELSRLMADNPPRLEDRPIVNRLRKAGLLLCDDADWDRLDPAVRRGAESGIERALDRVVRAGEAPPGEPVGDWRVCLQLGAFGTDYLARAGAARAGLEAGPAADELPALVRVDSEGRPLAGRHRYALRFPPGESPPVQAFWTLTSYDDRRSLVHDPNEPHSISDWNGLALDENGALTINIQHERPRGRRPPNWLPSPPGPFTLLLRLYWPEHAVFDRLWSPPPVVRVDRA